MATDEYLVDLIKKGNVDDVAQFLDCRRLTGDHYRQYGEKWGYLHRKAFVTTAAACGHVDIMNALIARGFSAEERHAGGDETLQPIHAACREGHLSVVKSLVENHNVSVNIVKVGLISGENPLKILLSEGKRNVYPIARFLLTRGARFECLHAFSNPFSVDCIMNPNATPELLQLLISHGAGVNNGGSMCPPPLHMAVDKGSIEFVKILLDAGADIGIRYWRHACWSPLPHRRSRHGKIKHLRKMQLSVAMLAAIKNDLPILKVLYSHGADPDYNNNCGLSVIHIAAARGSYDVARYLIVDIGVALDKKDVFGETPFIHAVAGMHAHIVQLILKAGYNPKARELEFDDSNPIFDKEGVSELLQEVRQLTSVPRTLEELCIFRLRHLLCRDLSHAVESLSLPNPLKNLIRLTHV